ncbi:MAG: tyrosine-type recombinase/integrase, partial [Lachnospiraceae bacterium]|nr:tyrosine-type recombinase/integrase [Lachnospiraceae bacterium]
KTNNGFRTIPMTAQVIESLNLQKMKQLDKGIKDDVSVCGHKGFVFTAKTGKPFAPNGFNAILMNIINAYNRQEDTAPLPPISGHTLRHTACTRMAESGIDPKVLQIIMGHGDIGTTMNIYNHCDILRLELEMRKYEGGICEA